MEPRICSMCGQEKDTSEFPLRNRLSSRRQSYCKDCKAKMGKNWYENNKQHHVENVMENTKNAKQAAREFIYQCLLTHPCTSCGESDPAVLEFHHVGKKTWEIGRMIGQGYGIKALAAEISQCVVLCANCQRRLTAKENGWYKGR